VTVTPASWSRWLDDLGTRLLTDTERAGLAPCEQLRQRLAASTEEIGDVFERDGGTYRTTVGEESALASAPPVKGLVLYRLVRAMRPAVVTELGTALGVSACYLASALRANGHGVLRTIEGSPSRHAVARRSIADLGLDDWVDARVGLFDEHLDALDGAAVLFLDGDHHEEPTRRYVDAAVARMAVPAVIALDDVAAYSAEMATAWATLEHDARFSAAHVTEGLGCLALGDVEVAAGR
jgi:predicted O-methyltransferase YrrM